MLTRLNLQLRKTILADGFRYFMFQQGEKHVQTNLRSYLESGEKLGRNYERSEVLPYSN